MNAHGILVLVAILVFILGAVEFPNGSAARMACLGLALLSLSFLV